MLIGQYEAKIGVKHQVSFPKKFREALGDKLILTKGLDNNLILVSKAHWQTLLEGTKGQPFTNKSARSLQQFLLGNAAEVELDAKGRFIIPDYLRKYGHIHASIIFAGMDRFVEMWDKQQWEKQQIILSKSIESIAEKLTISPAQKETEKDE